MSLVGLSGQYSNFLRPGLATRLKLLLAKIPNGQDHQQPKATG